MYQLVLENLDRGVKEKLYRPEIDKDIVAKSRIESAFLAFNQDVYPHSKYRISDVARELGLLFMYSIATPKGIQLIEKYQHQRLVINKN